MDLHRRDLYIDFFYSIRKQSNNIKQFSFTFPKITTCSLFIIYLQRIKLSPHKPSHFSIKRNERLKKKKKIIRVTEIATRGAQTNRMDEHRRITLKRPRLSHACTRPAANTQIFAVETLQLASRAARACAGPY